MMKVIRALGEVSGPLFVTTRNESVVLGKPARVTIHLGEDGSPLLELYAVVEHKQGADGGLYPAVVVRAVSGKLAGVEQASCTCQYFWHNPQDHDAKCPVAQALPKEAVHAN